MASLGDRVKWGVAGAVFGAHKGLYRLSGGRLGHRVPGFGPVLLLDYVGRRTGNSYTTPLLYLPDGEDLVIVGSKGGTRRHPAWWLNLREMEETTVQVGTERRRVVPRQASPSEKARLWPRLVEMYAPYESYQERTERDIPVILLSPAAEGQEPERG